MTMKEDIKTMKQHIKEAKDNSLIAINIALIVGTIDSYRLGQIYFGITGVLSTLLVVLTILYQELLIFIGASVLCIICGWQYLELGSAMNGSIKQIKTNVLKLR